MRVRAAAGTWRRVHEFCQHMLAGVSPTQRAATVGSASKIVWWPHADVAGAQATRGTKMRDPSVAILGRRYWQRITGPSSHTPVAGEQRANVAQCGRRLRDRCRAAMSSMAWGRQGTVGERTASRESRIILACGSSYSPDAGAPTRRAAGLQSFCASVPLVLEQGEGVVGTAPFRSRVAPGRKRPNRCSAARACPRTPSTAHRPPLRSTSGPAAVGVGVQ